MINEKTEITSLKRVTLEDVILKNGYNGDITTISKITLESENIDDINHVLVKLGMDK